MKDYKNILEEQLGEGISLVMENYMFGYDDDDDEKLKKVLISACSLICDQHKKMNRFKNYTISVIEPEEEFEDLFVLINFVDLFGQKFEMKFDVM